MARRGGADADAAVAYAEVDRDDNPAAKPPSARQSPLNRAQLVRFGPGATIWAWLVVVLLLGNIMMNTPLGYTLWTRQKQLNTVLDGTAKITNSLASESPRIARTIRGSTGLVDRMVRTFGKMDMEAMHAAIVSMNSMAASMGDPSVHGTMAAALDFFQRSSTGIGTAADSANVAFTHFSRVLDAFSTALSQQREAEAKARAEAEARARAALSDENPPGHK